ncbi:MAG: alpha/beta hydrolase [Gemmatimonadaceae bacterium]
MSSLQDPNPVAMTPSAVGLVRERALTFDAAGYRIPAALTVPTSVAPGDTVPSVVLLIPGSLFCDVNGDFPTWNVFPHVYGHLARLLSARGHVVYRFAKLGPGTGSVAIDEATATRHRTWAARLVIARAALAAMHAAISEERLTAQRTILSGHSEGSVVVSQLALDSGAGHFDAVALLAGPSVGILDIMREQSPRFAPPGSEEEYSRDIAAAVEHVRRGDMIPSDLAAKPAARALGAMDAVALAYMRDCDATDPTVLASHITQPVLIVQGGRDGSVPTHHGERLRDARTGPTTYEYVAELQHMFKALPEGTPPMAAFGLAGETDPRAVDAIDRWIRSLA